MAEKCFCHLNGYAVKDATARAELEELKATVDALSTHIHIYDDMSNWQYIIASPNVNGYTLTRNTVFNAADIDDKTITLNNHKCCLQGLNGFVTLYLGNSNPQITIYHTPHVTIDGASGEDVCIYAENQNLLISYDSVKNVLVIEHAFYGAI